LHFRFVKVSRGEDKNLTGIKIRNFPIAGAKFAFYL